MEKLNSPERQLKSVKAMLLFPVGGMQDNFTRQEIPEGYHTITVYEHSKDFTETIQRSPEDTLREVIMRFGTRFGEPPDLTVGYYETTTPEELDEKIRIKAAMQKDPVEYEITGIVPGVFGFNERFVAEVAAYYNLQGAPLSVVDTLSDKAKTSGLLRETGFPTPQERVCGANIEERPAEIIAATDEIGLPTIMKPIDGAGSIGCEDDDPSLSEEERRKRAGRHVLEIIRYQKKFAKAALSPTLVQERLDGDEVGAQVIINHGQLFSFYTRKEMYENKERGHYFDSNDRIHEWCQTYISPHLPRLIGRLGLNNWFLNGDIKLPNNWREMPINPMPPTLIDIDSPTPEETPKFFPIDLQARPGGDGLAVLQSVLYNKNMGRIMIDIARGKDVRHELAPLRPRGAGAIEVGFPEGGVILARPSRELGHETITETKGLIHVNVEGFLEARAAILPLTSYFNSSGHPVVGVVGPDSATVRERLDKVFSGFVTVLWTDGGGLDLYHPDYGLVQIRDRHGEGFDSKQGKEMIQRLQARSKEPFTLWKKEYVKGKLKKTFIEKNQNS